MIVLRTLFDEENISAANERMAEIEEAWQWLQCELDLLGITPTKCVTLDLVDLRDKEPEEEIAFFYDREQCMLYRRSFQEHKGVFYDIVLNVTELCKHQWQYVETKLSAGISLSKGN